MKKIIAFAGSTSKTSINKQLVTYASSFLENAEVEILDFNDYVMPIYSIDEEQNGFPEAVNRLKEVFASADGFIISLAEHNGSYAAAYKSIIDWLSRVERKMFHDKPMLLMATSPGGRGGIGVLGAAKLYYPHAGANIVAEFSLPKFYENFSEGKLVNEEFDASLKERVNTLANNL